MSAQLIQFPGGRNACQAIRSIPIQAAQPLRALPRRLDCDDDSYRLSPALTPMSELIQLGCKAIIFGTFCVGIFMMCFALGW